MPRVTNADPNSRIVRAKHTMEITQAVMTSVTTALFETNLPGFNIKLIMNHEDFARFDFVKLGKCQRTLSRAIHKSHWFEQMNRMGSHKPLASNHEKFRISHQGGRGLLCQGV